VTADWEIKHVRGDLPLGFQLVEAAFLAYYTVELFIRIAVHRLYFFCNEEKNWNIFDFMLVLLSIQDLLVFYILTSSDSGGNLAFMRIFRLFKLAKILRTMRIVRMFRELSMILESFQRSLISLWWSLVILSFALYIFALIFVQGFAGFLALEADTVDTASLQAIFDHFGSVALAIVSLYMAVTSGNDWSLYYDIIKLCGIFYQSVFVFFTFFSIFALFNILTGIFVEKAVLASQPDRDELILEQTRKSRKEAEEFRALCKRLDTENTGSISYEKFVGSMQDEKMVSYMATVGLEVHDVETFFKVVASSEGDADLVGVDQFVEGCMSLRGGASGLDMHKSLHETARLQRQLRAMQENFTSRMTEVSQILRQTHALAAKTYVDERTTKQATSSCTTSSICDGDSMAQIYSA